MSGKYNFILQNEDRHRELPNRIIVGRNETETTEHVLLKFLAYLLFYRERLQIEPQLHNDNIPFVPDLVQLDYELRPVFWIECGECSISKLNKLAVKIPEADIWMVRSSLADVEFLLHAMAKNDLRRNRYSIVALDPEMVQEMAGLLNYRNQMFWMKGDFDEGSLQFDFNGLWFDTTFKVLKF